MRFFAVVILFILIIHRVQSNTKALLLGSLQDSVEGSNEFDIAPMFLDSSVIPNVLSVIRDLIAKKMIFLETLGVQMAMHHQLLLVQGLKNIQISLKLFTSALEWVANNILIAEETIQSLNEFNTTYNAYLENWLNEQNENLLSCGQDIQANLQTCIVSYSNQSRLDVSICIEDGLTDLTVFLDKTTTDCDYYSVLFQLCSSTVLKCLELSPSLSSTSQEVLDCVEDFNQITNDLESGTNSFEILGGKIEKWVKTSKTIGSCFDSTSTDFKIGAAHIAETILNCNEEKCLEQLYTTESGDTETNSNDIPSSTTVPTKLKDKATEILF